MQDLTAHIPAFLSAYAILLVAALAPGPAVAMLLGLGLSRGRGAAMVATLGIAAGSVVLNLVTMLGVGLLLQQAAWAMQGLKLAGAGYLAWLSFKAFRRAANPPAIDAAPVAARGLRDGFVAGLLLQVTNPKAIVFWLAIAAVGATTGGGLVTHAAFVLGAFLITLTCHAGWALVLSSGPVRAAYQHARARVEATLGAFFAFFAYKLATEKL